MSKTIKDLATLFKPEVVVPTKLVKINILNEEYIVEQQIQKLRKQSEAGELTLEEAKKLEIFVKLKKVINENTPKDAETDLPPGMDESQLMQIAGSGDEQKSIRSDEGPSNQDPVE